MTPYRGTLAKDIDRAHLGLMSMRNRRMVRPPYPGPADTHAKPGFDLKGAGMAVWVVALTWLVVVFDPQWFIASKTGVRAILKFPVLVLVVLLSVAVWSALTSRAFAKRWDWFAPLGTFVIISIVSSVFAINLRLARDVVQPLVLYWVLIVASVGLLRSARQVEWVLLVYGLQFTVWGVLGGRAGLIRWNPVLANYDGYGAWMVVGGGLCAFLALATDHKWLKRLLALTVALCAIGVVSSFARGAFLSAIAVAGVVWLRSPHKLKATGYALGCAVIFLVSSTILFGAEYWQEMATISEGTEEATGEDRWVMWQAGGRVFLENPILGAGPGNWGVYAATNFRPGQVGGKYSENPGMLYGRSLHSTYVKTLSEEGILGVICLLWILVDFWRRNTVLRSKAAARAWERLGGRLRLTPIGLGIEAAMVGWMGAAAVYSLAGSHWFYTILGLNLILHLMVTREMRRARGSGRQPVSRRPARRPVPERGRPQPVGVPRSALPHSGPAVPTARRGIR